MEQDGTKTANYDSYECAICQRNFLTLWCLQLHEKIHNNAVQWCEECGTRFTCFSDLYQHLTVHISGETSPRSDSKSSVGGETGKSDLGRLGVQTDQFRTEHDHETDQFRTEHDHEAESRDTDQCRTEHDHETERGETDQFRTERDHEAERGETDQFRTEDDHETERGETDQFRTERDHEAERGETDQCRTEHDHETERGETDQFRTERDHEAERGETDQFRTEHDHETESGETDQFRTERDHEAEREQSGSDDMLDLTDGSRKYDGLQSEPNNPGIDGSDPNVAQNDCDKHEDSGQLSSSSNGMGIMSCHQCHKSFSYKTVLMLHLRKHKKKTPYKCGICGLGFISWNAYKLHRKSYGNIPHKKRDPCKTVEKESTIPVGYCSKMFPQMARFPKTNSTFRSTLLTGTGVEAKDGSPVSKYSGWFMCLICGAKVRGRRGSLAHHKLFHVGHELSNVKTSGVPGLQRPWLKCSTCNKKIRSRTNLDIHESRCDQGREFTEEHSEKVVGPGGDAFSGLSSRERSKFPKFDSELRRLSSKHGLTGPWRKCVLCSRRCRGWHKFNRHLELMHTETYRSITTARTSTISKNFKGLSGARSGNFKYALSFTKCTDNMQCSWYSCCYCKRKFQGRKNMKRHHATCSRIAEICGTRNTSLKGTMVWKKKTVNWYKTSQKKNCSMYRCGFCGTAFKGRQRVVEHVRQCSKKLEHSGTFPAESEDVKSQNLSPSQSGSQQQGHSSDNPDQLFRGTWTICSKCGKTCKGYIDLCVHRKSCGESKTRNDPKTQGAGTNDALASSNYWKYGCWYCCRSCKEKCRGYQQMLYHVCPPTSNFERCHTNWYRCRSCGQSCRSHHGMRDHVCPPADSSGEIGSQLGVCPRTILSKEASRHSSQYYAALYGFAQNGSWYKCNVCGQNCMGKWSLEKHTHHEATSGQGTSDFSKNGTWYWCKVCKMRLRGEKSLKSHVHVGSKCSRKEEEPWVVMGHRGPAEVKTELGTPETGNEHKEDAEESPVLVKGDNSHDGHDSKPQSDSEKGEYFGWTVITEFSDNIHLQEPKVNERE